MIDNINNIEKLEKLRAELISYQQDYDMFSDMIKNKEYLDHFELGFLREEQKAASAHISEIETKIKVLTVN